MSDLINHSNVNEGARWNHGNVKLAEFYRENLVSEQGFNIHRFLILH